MTFDWREAYRFTEMPAWKVQKALKDLHERLSGIEEKQAFHSEDDESIEELVEHYEPSSLALQVIAGRSNSKIMHHLWLKERRRADELQSRVDAFVECVVNLDPYNWSSDQKAFFITKLQELGLMPAGGQGGAEHPDPDPPTMKDPIEIEKLREAMRAGWHLSVYAASIHWDGSENTPEWIDGLGKLIMDVQEKCKDLDPLLVKSAMSSAGGQGGAAHPDPDPSSEEK